MTLTDERRTTFEGSEVVSPRAASVARRLRFWLILALILAIFVAIAVVATGASPSKVRLSATNPGPTGAEALVNVLRADHVTVTTPHTLGAALKDSSDSYNTTLVLYDPNGYLSTAQLNELGGASSSIVLIEPSTPTLDALAPSVAQAGYVPSRASADCDLSPAVRAGSVSGLGRGYRIVSDSSAAQGCLGTGGVHSLVRLDVSGQTVWVLGSTTILTNGSILRAGNAALDLGVLGATKRVVWYLPSFADVHSKQDGALPAPPWVTLVILLLGLVAISAIFWRGRRFGAIVVERMPVFVKSNETAEGRARLYQKASARAHSLDALRIGTLGRVAILCGLPAKSTLEDVIGAVARYTGRPAHELHALLVGDIPRTDTELLNLASQLRDLEAEVANAVRSR